MHTFQGVILFLLSVNPYIPTTKSEDACGECKLIVVESIPEGLNFNSSREASLTTFEAWKELIGLAEENIEIGSYYWTLGDQEYAHPTSSQGKEILRLLKETGTTGGVEVSITQDLDSDDFPNHDTAELEAAGAAQVRKLNFTRLLAGSGILHTKMWVVDRKHFYIGSANFDWRAMTQVKELGIMGINCTCHGKDLGKAFDVYWALGEEGATVPEIWDPQYEPEHGKDNPMSISLQGSEIYTSYIASSPPELCPNGRTTDLESIFAVIDEAEEFIHIAVMDYFPLMLFTPQRTYWPDIDNRLRSAAIDRKIKIRLLMSKWDSTRANAFNFLNSLELLNNVYPGVDIQKMFEVPSTEDQAKIPFARVNHSKFMVTDKAAYIGTSNWSGDYFLYTAGIGLVVKPSGSKPNLNQEIMDIFARDWNSTYAKPLSAYEEPAEAEDCNSRGGRAGFFVSNLALLLYFAKVLIY